MIEIELRQDSDIAPRWPDVSHQLANREAFYETRAKMHELSVAESIINAVAEAMVVEHLSSVSVVGVRIGAVSGVLADALEFSFEVAKDGTALEGTKLEIEPVPAEGRCRHCKAEVTLIEGSFLCPECGLGAVDLLRGHELEISYIEAVRSPDGKPGHRSGP